MLSALAQSALLGTERGTVAVPAAPGELGQVLARLPEATPERRVLLAAAVMAPAEAAGRQPTPLGTAMPAPASEEVLPAVSQGAALVLCRLLAEYPECLAEWLHLAAANGQRVPPTLLPELLDAGRRLPALRAAIAPVIGQRGWWLAGQNRDWQWLLTKAAEGGPVVADSAWETGNEAERLAWLRQSRTAAPARARDLIAAAFATENAATRTKMIDVLADQLSQADEPFLESGLDDRSKQVRQQAAALLARLVESRYADRMCRRAAACLRVERKLLRKVLRVELPGEPDAAAERDGIAAAGHGGKFGLGAWRLLQVVASTPLAHWQRSLGWHPPDFLRALAGNEWGDAAIAGLERAALAQNDPDWAQALLLHAPAGTELDRLALLAVLPAERREEALLRLLAEGGLGDEALLNLVQTGQTVWGERLSAVLLDRVFQRQRDSWQLRSLLKPLACRLAAPVLADALRQRPELAAATDPPIIAELRTWMYREFTR